MAALEEPTKPQNSYWIWLGENRAAIANEIGGGNVGAVGKVAGERWKAMTEAQKNPFEKKAEAAKVAYEKAMEEFKAKGGVPGKRRQEKAAAKKAKADTKARKEARKDPNRPKKPQTAYWLWLGENRAALTQDVGSGKAAQVAKVAGERWKALAADKKAPFENKADKLREAYLKAMAEYKKTHGGAADDDDDEEDEDDDKEN